MKQSTKFKIILMAFSALFSAVTAVISQIFILTPAGVPLTFQSFAIALCGYVLGAKCGTAAVGVYILMGTVGLPVFSGFKGGIYNLFGVTGGFLFGFLLLSLLCGMAAKKEKAFIKILYGLAGLVFCHLLGILQFCFISKTGFLEGFITVSLLYIPKDVILVATASVLSKYIKKKIKITD